MNFKICLEFFWLILTEISQFLFQQLHGHQRHNYHEDDLCFCEVRGEGEERCSPRTTHLSKTEIIFMTVASLMFMQLLK